VSLKIVLGVGNPLGGDDAVGSYVARRLNEKLKENFFEFPGILRNQNEQNGGSS